MIPPSEAPVCTDPKLFVGGLAFEIDREAVATHFGQYGPLRDCALLKHADGKSKGCAMVLYNSWAHAEAAIASENGAMNHLSGPRQLIVKFADPQRCGVGCCGCFVVYPSLFAHLSLSLSLLTPLTLHPA